MHSFTTKATDHSPQGHFTTDDDFAITGGTPGFTARAIFSGRRNQKRFSFLSITHDATGHDLSFATNQIKGKLNAAITCDSSCTSARGHRCTCSCGGNQHGRDFL